MQEHEELKYLVGQDPACSYWLKDAIEKLDNRDPVDALKDLATLNRFIDLKLNLIETR